MGRFGLDFNPLLPILSLYEQNDGEGEQTLAPRAVWSIDAPKARGSSFVWLEEYGLVWCGAVQFGFGFKSLAD